MGDGGSRRGREVGMQRGLEGMVEAFDHAVGLRVVGCGEPREEARADQRDEVNWRPRSEVISRGMPKRATQWRVKAHAHSSAEMLARGMALGQ